jgi:hypothetical protein
VLVCFIAVGVAVAVVASPPSVTFSADVSAGVKPFTHVIEKCFGSGHALLGLREDWRVTFVPIAVPIPFLRAERVV